MTTARPARSRPRARGVRDAVPVREIETPAIVLWLGDTGEADVLATLFTRDEGLVRGIAPSAKKSFRRFGGRLDLLNHIHVTYRRKRGAGLVTLTDSELLASHAPLAANLAVFAQAEALAEVLAGLSPEGEPHRDLYALAVYYLERLLGEAASLGAPARNTSRAKPLTIGLYGFRALGVLGYQPALDHCVITGEPLDTLPADALVLSAHRGGITTTPAIRDEARTGVPLAREESAPLSRAAVKILATALAAPPPMLARLHPSHAAGRELAHALRVYTRYLLGRELKSLVFLERMRHH